MQERDAVLNEIVGRSGRHKVQPVARDRAIGEWEARRKRYGDTGRWPLILTSDIFFRDRSAIDLAGAGTLESVLEKARQLDVSAMLKGRMDRYLADILSDLQGKEREEFLRAWAKPKPSDLESDELVEDAPYFVQDGDGPVWIVEVPCTERWAALAEFPWGSWNEAPSDPEVVAVARSWERRFGAVPMTLSHDVIELWLDQPVTLPEVACEVAVEQAALCQDIVDQGTETVAALAQSLLGNKVWFFWWD